MISRRARHRTYAADTFIQNSLAILINSLQVESFTYVDEIFTLLAQRISALGDMGNLKLRLLDERNFPEGAFFTRFFSELRELSDFNFQCIPDCYSDLNGIANEIIARSEQISTALKSCSDLINVVEGNIKRRSALSSIKDEILFYDTIGNGTLLKTGTLTIDKRSGSLLLPIASSNEIEYTIEEIICNKPRGSLGTVRKGDSTWKNISNGYFHSRLFSDSPVLENLDITRPERMKDGDLETSFLVEYNSFLEETPLEMNLKLRLVSPQKVDMMEIAVEPPDQISGLSGGSHLPQVEELIVSDTGGNRENLIQEMTDNRIAVKGCFIGAVESGIAHRPPDVYPTANYVLSRPSVSEIDLRFSCPVPQLISYPEKVIRNSSGSVIRRFNYFETLVLNKYEAPGGHPDPKDFYTEQEIADMAGEIYSNVVVEDERIALYRHCIGLKELRLVTHTFATEGEIISANLNSEAREIAGAQIYALESIPVGTGIRYFLSTDLKTWVEISPENRREHGSLPIRLVYDSSLESETGDLSVGMMSKTLYLKITMSGRLQRTPVLKAYAVRIKLI